MTRKKTDAEFKKEVYDLVGNEYTFLDAYVNANTKVKVRHNKCGNVYDARPSGFLMGHRCPYCAKLSRSNKLAKTNDKFKQEIFNLVGDEYTLLDSYVNAMTKLRVKHNKCGHTYGVRPHDFLKGSRCPYCSGKMKKTDVQFKQEIFELTGNEYTFLDPYVNAHAKIRVKHNKCDKVYRVEPSSFLQGCRCPYCAGNILNTDNQFNQKIKNLVGNEYTFLDSYVNRFTKIRVKHNQCGNVYMVTPGNFLCGYRCPYCNSPKGEVNISKVLKSLGIKYESQKTFDDLKDKDCLSYDFYIPDQSILIEYQGQQHYEPVDYFGGESQFRIQQKHDRLKSDYAKDHNYKLIAVPYTEDTFSKIKNYLLQHGLAK